MEKRIAIVVLLVLLSGCQRNLRVACNFVQDDSSIDLDIKAINDDISSIKVRTCFVIPNVVMFDETKLKFVESQLDSSYHFEDNKLIREYDIDLDDAYSLNKTVESLRKKRFYCE